MKNVVVEDSLKANSISIPSVLILTVLGSTFLFSLTPVFATNPACGATLTANTTLTGDIGVLAPCLGNGLVIGKNGITLNCAGFTISGTVAGDGGVYLSGRKKVTVENCIVTGFSSGIYLYDSSDNIITGNTANGNYAGIFLTSHSNKNHVTGNVADNNHFEGFYIVGSSGNILTGNTANNNQEEGFSNYMDASKNILTGNTAKNNLNYGYYDLSTSSSPGVPHWDTKNSYTSDTGSGNVLGLAGPNANMSTATSPF